MILLLLALQETSVSPARPVLLDIPFDLAKVAPSSGDPHEIVVTGRRVDQRLPPLPEVRDDILPKAEIGVGNGTLGIVAEPHGLPGGVTSNRVMVKWKLKF